MTINCKGTLIDLSCPKVMGILNITPDSFFDGGKFNDQDTILQHTKGMLDNGATFIDIGGYSSKPGAKNVSLEEEESRIIPIIQLLIKEFPKIILSIDTFRSEIAKKAINNGASIINDISGGELDHNMFKTVSELQVPYILMHMKGTPQNMQNKPNYENIITEINEYFAKKTWQLKSLGVNDIILDPGFGFGKTLDHNFELLKKQHLIGFGKLPILTGVSRKSMISKTLNISPEEALNGTTVLNTIALQKGTSLLRVHDVKEAMECVKLFNKSSNT